MRFTMKVKWWDRTSACDLDCLFTFSVHVNISIVSGNRG